MSGLCVQDGQSMVLIGDSITDCGRRGDAAPFGNGYVACFIDLVAAKYTERSIRFANQGIGGNTVLELTERWETDVVAERPDWLSVMIGINDLHRTLGGVHDLAPGASRELYSRLLERTAEAVGSQLVLLEPFYMTTHEEADDAQRIVLDLIPRYIEVVHDLAREFGARLVRTHEMFARHLRHRPAAAFGAEPVHPNHTGHLLIAWELLQTLEA